MLTGNDHLPPPLQKSTSRHGVEFLKFSLLFKSNTGTVCGYYSRCRSVEERCVWSIIILDDLIISTNIDGFGQECCRVRIQHACSQTKQRQPIHPRHASEQ